MSAPVAHAWRAIGAGSRSFAQAARLLPREARDSAVLLYAWCRHCDDVVDGQRLGHDARGCEDAAARVAALRERTGAAFEGRGGDDDPAFAALAAVARRHALPREWADALLDGFQMDADGREHATLADVLRYCYHVAGVVGLMMARVLGVRDDATLDRACDLGIAFQLTNIARDVEDDARLGRVYLPGDWLAAAGVSRAALATAGDDPGVHALRCRLLSAAEPYYASADAGIARLPWRAACGIAAARDVYRDIGRVIRERAPAAAPGVHAPEGTAPAPRRAWVPARRRWSLLAAACATATVPRLGPARAPRPRDGLWTRPS